MSGHSKWATIKHKKAATDAKRGRIFTRLIREIAIAARSSADPTTNARLRTAISAAKNENMPSDNIERAILRGSGQLEGEQLEEINFEGYGPGGVGLIVQVVTSSRNRTVSEIRHALSKNGGNMAEAGAVGWMFERKGELIVPKEEADEDKMMSIVLDAGAEDLKDDGEAWDVVTPPEAFEAVREAITKAGITPASAEIGMVPEKLREACGRAGAADASPHGIAGRSRRCAARLGKFRRRREGTADRERVSLALSFAPGIWICRVTNRLTFTRKNSGSRRARAVHLRRWHSMLFECSALIRLRLAPPGTLWWMAADRDAPRFTTEFFRQRATQRTICRRVFAKFIPRRPRLSRNISQTR